MSANDLSAERLDAVLAYFDTPYEGIQPVRKIAFVFSGHGTEWVGMGRSLLKTEPVFRTTMEACAKAHEASFPAGALGPK